MHKTTTELSLVRLTEVESQSVIWMKAGPSGDGQVELVKVVVNDPVQVKVKEAMVRWRNGLMEVSGCDCP